MERHLKPLAARLRPRTLDRFIGQKHLLGAQTALGSAIRQGHVYSMILWGPAGVGKTTLAQLIAERSDSAFIACSAVTAGVKQIRDAEHTARSAQPRRTILFLDEIHRFNKAQQDTLLPSVEDGALVLIGATTENPAFVLNNALLSRLRVHVLKKLTSSDLRLLMQHTFADAEYGLGGFTIEAAAAKLLSHFADGDARQLLNMLELASGMAQANHQTQIGVSLIHELTRERIGRFDRGGDLFYEQISALHKAVRGCSPDAALYWLARMFAGGCDPQYIARRMVRMASEDIGNADPRALGLTLDAWQAYERLGSPEGELALAQAAAYLASIPKSNAVYQAWKRVTAQAKAGPDYAVPLHLRNAPTRLHKAFGYGEEYRYAHDEPEHFSAGENYFPPELKDAHYYQPAEQGFERRIRNRLRHLYELNRQSPRQRYS